MTVRELRDKLDFYIKHDPGDILQLNDVELDAQLYKERCEERANQEVVVLDDGMRPSFYGVGSSIGVQMPIEVDAGKYTSKDVFALVVDVTNELT